MSECRLLEENGQSALLTKRFDRPMLVKKITCRGLLWNAALWLQSVAIFQAMEQPYSRRMAECVRLSDQRQSSMLFGWDFLMFLARNCWWSVPKILLFSSCDRKGKCDPVLPDMISVMAYRPVVLWVSCPILNGQLEAWDINDADFWGGPKRWTSKPQSRKSNRWKLSVRRWAEFAEEWCSILGFATSIQQTLLVWFKCKRPIGIWY